MDELKALWPLGKFPVLVDDGEVVAETTSIIEHLRRIIPARNIWIPDGEARPPRPLPRPLLRPPYPGQHAAERQPRRSRPDGEGLGRATRGSEALRIAYDWLRSQSCPTANGPRATRSRSPTAPPRRPSSTPTGSSAIGEDRPRLKAYRARLLAHPGGAESVEGARPYRAYFPLGAPDRD